MTDKPTYGDEWPSFELMDRLFLLLALLTAIYSAFIAIAYCRQPLVEMESYRQTQTAITAYWMINDGWRLAYETPVVGYPWSIPFEFPIYQSLVALLAWAFHVPLDATGRLVSFCFLLGCGYPALQTVSRLKLPRQVAWIFCVLLWSSPLYLFWGRAFLIETAALFFALEAVPWALDLRAQVRWRSVLLFATFATLAMLQKVTTAAPVLLVMGLLVLASHARRWIKQPSLRLAAQLAVAFGIPLVVGVAWVAFTDVIKNQSAYGAQLTSAAVRQLSLGTLSQRGLDTLKLLVWDRVIRFSGGGYYGAFLLVGALIGLGWRERIITAVCIVLFILPSLMFTNLHVMQDYYQVACGAFLLAALAMSIGLWLPRLGFSMLAPIAIVMMVAINLSIFNGLYGRTVRTQYNAGNNTILAIGDILRRYTPADSAIAVYGTNWSSAIPYYAERKALAAARAFGGRTFHREDGPPEFSAYADAWRSPERFLGGKKLAGIVFCPTDELDIKEIPTHPYVARNPSIFKVDKCFVYIPNIKKIDVADRGTIFPTDANRLSAKTSPK